MKTLRIITTIALLAGLTACEVKRSDDGDAPPDPDLSATPSPTPTEQVSILRPDVEAEQAEQGTPVVKLDPLTLTIGFPDGGDDLDDEALAVLGEVLASAQIEAGGPIVLGGHSDTGGTDAANLRASTARAEAVRDWFVEQGVEADRFEVIAFGEQNPVEPNALPDGTPNEEGRAVNRRVEISIVPPGSEAEEPVGAQEAEASADAGD